MKGSKQGVFRTDCRPIFILTFHYSQFIYNNEIAKTKSTIKSKLFYVTIFNLKFTNI